MAIVADCMLLQVAFFLSMVPLISVVVALAAVFAVAAAAAFGFA